MNLKKSLFITGLCFGFLSKAGSIQFHQGVGIGGGWQESLGGFAKYNARLNIFGTETWTVSFSASPILGGEIQRPDQNAFRPYFLMPSTTDFNWGMGSSRDCLRYRGYSLKIGVAPSTFATFDKAIFSRNIKSVPGYISTNYKFQTKNLKTFSFEIGGIITQKNQSYLNDFGIIASFNYLFGIY